MYYQSFLLFKFSFVAYIIFKMNGEVDYEKVMQIQFHGVNYIVTVKADSQGLLLELQDKFNGDLWESYYEPQFIEQITSKTGNLKRYNVFAKMLVTALTGNSDSVHVDVLTHHDLQIQAARKNGGSSKTTDPKLINKRYLIMSYMAQFDKVHYPLPLDYISSPEPQRLKLTIRRLSQQLQCFQSNPKTDSIVKQLSAIKHENQLLKSKLRSLMRNQSKQNQSANSLNKQIQEQNKQLKQEIANLKLSNSQQVGKKTKIINEKDKKIQELQNKLKIYQKNNKEFEIYQQKFNSLYKQTNQMASALQHSKQNEKKSQLKINNLQKQLQKMMAQLKKRHNISSTNNNMLNSPRKSDNGSIKSTSSISKKKPNGNSTNKNIPVKKNSSVFDSDTESSRMRKNGRGSPYRQSSRPLNTSNSAKKKEQQRTNAISKYSNISNLYKKDRSRSRSKSKSVKREVSPPSQNFQSSAIMTEGIDYPSDDEDDNKVSSTMARLRNHRNKKILEQKNKGKQKQKKNNINPIQQKISSIASLMRNLRNNSSNIEAGNMD